MFTGDPALDAWLAAHGMFVVVAVSVVAFTVMLLVGLARPADPKARPGTQPVSSNRKAARR